MRNWADAIERSTGLRLHDRAGAGAAGGMAGALMAFCGAQGRSGVELTMEYSGFYGRLREADLVITGEGRIDAQTLYGKAVLGIARAAAAQDVPAVALAGSIGPGTGPLHEQGLRAVHSIAPGPLPLEEAVGRAAELLTAAAEQLIRTFMVGYTSCGRRKQI